MVAIIRFSLAQVLVIAIFCLVMADEEEQRRREEMINDFEDKVSLARLFRELIDGDIYCVFHFPDHQGSNEDDIMLYDNRASVRVFLHQYQEENSDVFFFSTNRDDLVVDPERDPNKLKPILGSSEPPYPTNPKDHLYLVRRNGWKKIFESALLGAVEEGGESLGDIYYRWFHIDSGTYSKRYPDPIRRENTEAVRKVLKEEKIRHPHEFFFSCDEEDLTVDMLNPTLPPRMGSLFPAYYQPQANATVNQDEIIAVPLANQELDNNWIGEGVHLIRSKANNALVAPMEVLDEPLDDEGDTSVDDNDEDDEHVGDIEVIDHNSPLPIPHSAHTLGAPVPLVYLAPSVSSIGTTMPELILPSMDHISISIIEQPEDEAEEALEQPDALMMAMKEANIDQYGDYQIEDISDVEQQKRQKQIVDQFLFKISQEKTWLEYSVGDIYCVFHFPGHQGSNEKEIMRYDNKSCIRLVIYRYRQKHSDVFFYSTNRDDLVVDPARDPNKLKPKQGSYIPPPPKDPKSFTYRSQRNAWQTRFYKLLSVAEGKGGKSLGIIYFRWYHIDDPNYSLKHPYPEQRYNTEPIRRLLEEEHVRHPHEFFYSCDAENLDVDFNNPDKPPKMGSLYPAGTPTIRTITVHETEEQKQKRMVDQFTYEIKNKRGAGEKKEGEIYCVFHFPGHQGSNEGHIMRYDNKPFFRLFIYRYQKKLPGIFYYSTDRDDLVVDPARDPNKVKPKMGSYLPSPPKDCNDPLYCYRRYSWEVKFKKELLAALDKGGESLGDIYYRWFHIGDADHSKRHPNPIRMKNTEAVRRLLEEEHVRHPYEFFYSCEKEGLTVDLSNPTRPPTMGSLYPPDYQLEADASLDHGLTGEPRTSATSTVSEPLVSPHPIPYSPHTSGTPVSSVYVSSGFCEVIPELILPPTTTAVSTPATSGIDHPQPDALKLAMIEADLGEIEFYTENPEYQMEEDRDGSGNGASAMAPLIPAATTAYTQENNHSSSHNLVTLYPSEIGNDTTFPTPVTASLPASLQYMLGSSTDPGMEPVVPAPTNYGIHPSSSSLQETHSLDDEMENSSESDIESFSDEENVGIPEDLNQYNVPSNDLYNVQQHEEVEDVEMMDVLDDIIGLEEDFGVANDGVMPDENQILADLHNIAEQEGDAEMLGNALMMGMMGADYNPYDFPPDDEEEH